VNDVKWEIDFKLLYGISDCGTSLIIFSFLQNLFFFKSPKFRESIPPKIKIRKGTITVPVKVCRVNALGLNVSKVGGVNFYVHQS